jgi:hypothetical protein
MYQYVSLDISCQHVSLATNMSGNDIPICFPGYGMPTCFHGYDTHHKMFPGYDYFNNFPLGLKCQYVSLI